MFVTKGKVGLGSDRGTVGFINLERFVGNKGIFSFRTDLWGTVCSGSGEQGVGQNGNINVSRLFDVSSLVYVHNKMNNKLCRFDH